MRKILIALGLIAWSISADASPFGLKFLRKSVTVTAVTYDVSIGNGVDSNGHTALPLRSGAKRFYVNSGANSITGSDSNTCTQAQSPSTPKLTAAAGVSCVTQFEGDQVLIAEGTSYAEALPGLNPRDGFSYLYPTVIESYDATDPTNEAKIGRQNAVRPIFTGSNPSLWVSPCCNGSTVVSYIAVRNMDIEPGNVSGQGITAYNIGDGVLFENDIFAYTALTLQTSWQLRHHWVVRGNALYGSFDIGSSTGGQQLYVDGTDSYTEEDNVFYHSGWKIGASRTDDWSLGGTSVFKHPFYIQDPVNAVERRNLIVDGGADGGTHRGATIMQDDLLIDNPINGLVGNGTGEQGVRPNGMDFEISGMAAIGGGTVNSGATDWGIHTALGRSGSFAKWNLLARSSSKASNSFTTDVLLDIPSYADYSNNVAYQWANSGSTVLTGSGGTVTLNNNVWDDPASGTNINIGSGTFTNTYTAAAFYPAAGYADKTAFVNAAIAHPEYHIQRAARALLLAGYGVTRPSTLDPLVGYHDYLVGTAEQGVILGLHDGSTLTYSGFPSCFSLTSYNRSWNTDTSCTSGTGTGTLTETAADGVTTRNTSVSWTVHQPPILTSATATPGTTTASLSVSTNTASGTLYWAVSTQAPQPAWPHYGNLKYGVMVAATAMDAYGSQAISSTGTKTVTATGLVSGSTYYAYFAHVDTNGWPSIIAVAGPFTQH